jgi:hypothetical protein
MASSPLFPLQVQFEMKVLFYPFSTISATAIVIPILGNNDGKDHDYEVS